MMKSKLKKNLGNPYIIITYTLEELNKLFSKNGKESLQMYLNISSLTHHHEELHSLVSNLNVQPKIIAISENRLKKGKQPISSIELKNYTFEHTATEANKEGTFYI